jgi:hypothetical protein
MQDAGFYVCFRYSASFMHSSVLSISAKDGILFEGFFYCSFDIRFFFCTFFLLFMADVCTPLIDHILCITSPCPVSGDGLPG